MVTDDSYKYNVRNAYQIIERFSPMVVIKYRLNNESRVKQYYDASSIV